MDGAVGDGGTRKRGIDGFLLQLRPGAHTSTTILARLLAYGCEIHPSVFQPRSRGWLGMALWVVVAGQVHHLACLFVFLFIISKWLGLGSGLVAHGWAPRFLISFLWGVLFQGLFLFISLAFLFLDMLLFSFLCCYIGRYISW